MSTISAFFDALSLWTNPTRARDTAAEDDGGAATTLDRIINALHSKVPSEGARAVTADELADTLMVPANQRAPLHAAFLSAEVKANGKAHVRLSSKVKFTLGDNTIVLGPDLHAKVSADRFETTTGFAIKVGFATPRVQSVERGEEDGERGIRVRTTLGSRFLPFA